MRRSSETFSGYGGLRRTDSLSPIGEGQGAGPRDGSRCHAARNTVLSGGHPRAKAPLGSGNEGTVSLRTLATRARGGKRVSSRDPTASVRMARGKMAAVRPEHSGTRPDRDHDVVGGPASGCLLTAQVTLTLGRIQARHAGVARDRWVGRQRDLSTRAGAGRRQGDSTGPQRGESRQGRELGFRRRGRPIVKASPRARRKRPQGRHRHRKHRRGP